METEGMCISLQQRNEEDAGGSAASMLPSKGLPEHLCRRWYPDLNSLTVSADGQLTESLTSLRDLTPLDSKDESESSEGSVSAPLSEQIKPKEEESSDADSNSLTLRNQYMPLLGIKGKLCNSVEESESSDDSGSCPAVNKPADSAVQMTHTPEFSDCGDTPALSNNIIEFSDNEETIPVSSELMDFSVCEEISAVTKNVMDFSESLKISSVSKQTVEISDMEESQQSETEQRVIRNDSRLLELDTVAASTTDPDLLFPAAVYPVSSPTVSEEQIFDLPVSDLDVKPATPMPPAVSLKLKTPENQHSEIEVFKKVMSPTKIKDVNLNLVFEDLMIMFWWSRAVFHPGCSGFPKAGGLSLFYVGVTSANLEAVKRRIVMEDGAGAVQDFEAAVQELVAELARLSDNIEAVTEYQSTVLRVTKLLCSWMENIEELSRHRKELSFTTTNTS
ncbi:hypothetical protein NDU88_000846 [Pleurodeles waltl]|uniref:Uncharacterized protein n=1 Tax=Pleurodeles waltl TaxID=8319 RepID=A0AAV7KNR7_PLEWA|nr:hypothetical protein NDU88_000846 [Pleurodeles waltl]